MRQKYKLIRCAAALLGVSALLGNALPLSAAVGDTFEYQGLKYTVLTEDPGNYTVTTKDGGMYYPNYFPGNSVEGKIVLPAEVEYSGNEYLLTEIGIAAFEECRGLTEITIPNSVTSIGDHAFGTCTGLTEITIPNSVTSIGYGAFYACSGLKEIAIPNSVTSIGNSAFSNCSGLTKITIPNSVTSIEAYTFSHCSSLAEITIPNSVTSIGNSAFFMCSGLKEITIPTSVTSIGAFAFSDCAKLTKLDIPSSVVTIYSNAFTSCTSLEKVVLPPFLTSIESGIFGNCSNLKEVVIPNSVTSIEHDAFNSCKSLESVRLGSGITSIKSGAFEGCESLKEIIIPKNVTSIESSAFSGSSALNKLSIGCGVSSISNTAFNGVSSLSTINIAALTPTEYGPFESSDASLFVPAASKSAYESANGWKNFKTMQTLIEPTEVKIEGDSKIYNAKPGDTFQLEATISPANVTMPYIFWRSTNPEFAYVDNFGKVTILEPKSRAATNSCEIIAETLYADAPIGKIEITEDPDVAVGIDKIESGDPALKERSNDVYTMQGVCLKRAATKEDIDALLPGLYIIGGKKVVVKK